MAALLLCLILDGWLPMPQPKPAPPDTGPYVVGKRIEEQHKTVLGVDKAGNAVVDLQKRTVHWIRVCGAEGEPRWLVVPEKEYNRIKLGDRYYEKKQP